MNDIEKEKYERIYKKADEKNIEGWIKEIGVLICVLVALILFLL